MTNPYLAFDNELIATIQNSLGINKITDYMLDIIGKLGTETTSESGYIDKEALRAQITEMGGKNPTKQEMEGIAELAKTYHSLGKDGIYKITTESKSQRNNISDGFEYLWTLLPNNARNVLKARHLVDGTSTSNPVNLIRNAFIKHTSETRGDKVDYDSAINKEIADTNAAKAKTHNQGTLEGLINGDLGTGVYNINNPQDTSYNLALTGNVIGQLTTANEGLVPATTLTNAFNSGIGKLIDKDNIYLGNQKITTAA